MKKLLLCLLSTLFLTVSASAIALPEELLRETPEELEELIAPEALTDGASLQEGLLGLWEKGCRQLEEILRQRVSGAVRVLLILILCGAAEGLYASTREHRMNTLYLGGALAITALTVGNMEQLMGLGGKTIDQLAEFAKVLLPSLAAASAAAGGVTGATMKQLATLFLMESLIELIRQLLFPLVLFYTALITAGTALADPRLETLAAGLKKLITWGLCSLLVLFTGYLSLVHVVTGSADGAVVKVAKAAVAGAVPVVGSIIAEATESVLAGAGLLRGAIGAFGTLSILAVCLYPFLQLGVQYVLCKLVAFLATFLGAAPLCRLVNGLAGAFGLVLGMTASCAMLLLISILSFASVVIP